ncbi:DNA-binding WRKY transcription factor [Tanacetum coccineum]
MIENEDFNTISQIVVVNNEMSNGFETDDEDYVDDDEVEDDKNGIDEETRGDDETSEAPHVDGQAIGSNKQTCTCGKWEINKYPCSHVLSARAFLSLNNLQYVQRYYSITNYSATWASEFSPLPHEAYWPKLSITLLPNSDLKRKGRGRPRSTRLRNVMDIKEGKKANKCGFCKQSGYNQKRCQSKPKKTPGDL